MVISAKMFMQPVNSSSIAAIGYDSDTRELTVRFRDSRRSYTYLAVEPEIFAALQQASSKGGFVNSRIKDHYRYERRG
jgi:hypothetical protein